MAKEVEEWRTLRDYPGYEVSNLGGVRESGSKQHLSVQKLDSKTFIVSLRKDGRPYSRAISALVDMAFPELKSDGR
jgi:NUMOD4 motif.